MGAHSHKAAAEQHVDKKSKEYEDTFKFRHFSRISNDCRKRCTSRTLSLVHPEID